MLALGLIMLVLAGLLIAAIATGTVQSFEVELFGVEVSTSNIGLFFSGVAVGVGVLLALALIHREFSRGWRRRQRPAVAEQPIDPGHTGGEQ